MIPADDHFRDFLAKDVRGRTVFYGASLLTSLGSVRDLGLEGTEIVWEGEAARLGLPGKFNFSNAIAAIAIALELSVSASSVRRGIESVKPLFGRGEIFYGRSTLIRDCYNSSPESSTAALDFCDNLEWPGRRIYILGSMLELGENSNEAHACLGRRLASCRSDLVFLFGEDIRPAAEMLGAKLALHTTDMGELSAALDKCLKCGDLVLLKGSRGCALEVLTEILSKKKGGATGGS